MNDISSSQAEVVQRPGSRLQGRVLGIVVSSLMLILLLEALDQTIVATALPHIVSQFQGFDRYTWVVTAYLLASTTMIPIVGKLSDQFGRKWFFLGGITLFLLGSMLAGTASTMDQLIIFRAIQGLGSGAGIGLTVTIVGDLFSPAERVRWQGLFAAAYGLCSVVGPTLGGWLSEHGPVVGNFVTDTSRWRWIFYINVPLGIIALVALFIYLPTNLSVRSPYRGWVALRRIDFVGTLLVSGGVVCLLLAMTWGSNQIYDWNSPQVIGTLIASGILYLLFFFAERIAVEPLLPLQLFRNRIFAADAVMALLTGAILLPLIVFIPLFLQGVAGQSSTSSGFALTPFTVSMVVGVAICGFIIGRIGRYQAVTIIGTIVMVIGVFLLAQMNTTTSILAITGAMIIAGLGLGIFFAVLTLVAQNALSPGHLGVGTGTITYLRALGQTLGVAIVGTVISNVLSSELTLHLPPTTLQALTPAELKLATNPQTLINPNYRSTLTQVVQKNVRNLARTPQQTQQLLQQIFNVLRQALAVALQHGFISIFICSLGVLVAACFLKDVPMRKSQEEVTDKDAS